MLPNASYFAFTATPKNKTLETFGENEHGEIKKKFFAFHTYSMKQAIEEEFILNVLENYTTWKSYYKVKKNNKISGEEEYELQEGKREIKK